MKSVFGFFCVFGAIAVILAGCSRQQQTSSLLGHFEGSSQQDLAAYEGKLSIVPEYQTGQNIIASQELFEYQGYTMLSSIVDAGVAKIYLVPSYQEADAPRNQLVKMRANANKGLAAAGIKQTPEVIAAMDRIFARVTILPRKEPLYVRHGDEAYSTVWARDWAPLTAQFQDNSYLIMDYNYYPDRPSDDSVPFSFAFLLESLGHKVPRVSLPVYNEGGNFMNTPEWCFMSTRVSNANSIDEAVMTAEDEVASRGKVTKDQLMNSDQIIDQYNRYGCKQTHIFEKLPNEDTGHIDMWSKLLNDNTVAVSDLSDQTIATLTERNFTPLSQGKKTFAEMQGNLYETQSFLRTQQEWFASHGFRVVLIPMPLNLWYFDELYFEGQQKILLKEGKSPEKARSDALLAAGSYLTRSYTNSLIINNTLLIPRYVSGLMSKVNPETNVERNDNFVYPDASLLGSYESATKKALEEVGFKVEFIETDQLITIGGSVHCSTMQTPL